MKKKNLNDTNKKMLLIVIILSQTYELLRENKWSLCKENSLLPSRKSNMDIGKWQK